MLEQQAMNVAPNLMTKDFRKEWETAFSATVVTPVLTVRHCIRDFLFQLFQNVLF